MTEQSNSSVIYKIKPKTPLKLIRFKTTATSNPILITTSIKVFASISLTLAKTVLLLVCYSQGMVENTILYKRTDRICNKVLT